MFTVGKPSVASFHHLSILTVNVTCMTLECLLTCDSCDDCVVQTVIGLIWCSLQSLDRAPKYKSSQPHRSWNVFLQVLHIKYFCSVGIIYHVSVSEYFVNIIDIKRGKGIRSTSEEEENSFKNIYITMAEFYSSVPVICESEPACTVPGPWNGNR